MDLLDKAEHLSLAGKLEGLAKITENNSDTKFAVKKLKEMSQEIQIKVADQ